MQAPVLQAPVLLRNCAAVTVVGATGLVALPSPAFQRRRTNCAWLPAVLCTKATCAALSKYDSTGEVRTVPPVLYDQYTFGALAFVRETLHVVLYSWLKAMMLGWPAAPVPFVFVKGPKLPRLSVTFAATSDVVTLVMVTCVPTDAALKPVCPVQRFTAAARLVALVVLLPVNWKLSPVFRGPSATRVTLRGAVPSTNVCVKAGLPKKVATHVSPVPEEAAPAVPVG